MVAILAEILVFSCLVAGYAYLVYAWKELVRHVDEVDDILHMRIKGLDSRITALETTKNQAKKPRSTPKKTKKQG